MNSHSEITKYHEQRVYSGRLVPFHSVDIFVVDPSLVLCIVCGQKKEQFERRIFLCTVHTSSGMEVLTCLNSGKCPLILFSCLCHFLCWLLDSTIDRFEGSDNKMKKYWGLSMLLLPLIRDIFFSVSRYLFV